MLYKKRECTFDGGLIHIYYWDGCPDGQEESDSYFYNGYIGVYVFGDGTSPLLGLKYWHILYTWQKYEPLVFSQESEGCLLIMVDDNCCFDDIHVGFARLKNSADAKQHPVVIADFSLPDGDLVKKFVALPSKGPSIEIPDDTMH
jgi:hypothetical protein